jgi:shikimate dehydrogenase
MDLGVAQLVIHDLDPAYANALCEDLAKHFGASCCRVARDLEDADGIVKATQVGMRGFPGNPVPASALRASHWCADVIYTPIETEFLKAAAARVLNGSGMCVHTAVEAFRLFTGSEPDLARLHAAFDKALIERDKTGG